MAVYQESGMAQGDRVGSTRRCRPLDWRSARWFAHDPRKRTPQDRGYGALTFAHVFGHTGMFSTFLHVGASIVLAAKFDAASAMRAMAGVRVSVFMVVPTMYWNLRDTPIPDGVDLS